jgi:putative thioredoxin
MIDLQLGTQPKPPAASFIKDTDELHFEQDALQASMAKPVIVQFWSASSASCKMLMSVLEKLVNEAAGAVLLAKVNANKNPGLVQALRIQSVPTVYVFFQGKPVDGFAGSKTEAELRVLVDGLKKLSCAAPDDKAAIAEHVKKFMAEADKFFKEDKFSEAMERYSGVLELDPDNMEALGGIGWCLLSQGDAESVREMLGQLAPEQLKAPRLQGLQYIISLGDDARDIAGLIDRLVAEVKKNREGEAKAKLLEVFEALGNAHPLTLPGRRKLSTVLFS